MRRAPHVWTHPVQPRKPITFRPPLTNSFVVSIARHVLLPLALRFHTKIEKIEIEEDGLRRLRALKGERVMLLPNHSEENEPYILFHLSKVLGDEFNYLTAQELFEKSRIQGWFLQRAGAYSIVRGTADRTSFRVTRQLLADGKRWLVAFPEGVAVGLGDLVMPFQAGVAQLAFWACEDMAEDMAKDGESRPIYLVPAAIKYLYLADMHKEINASLGRIEDKLLPNDGPAPEALYERLARVGEAVLAANEKARGVRPRSGASFNERVSHLREFLLSSVASALGITFRTDQTLMERIRILQNSIDQILYAEPAGSDYERELLLRRQAEVRELSETVLQVRNFVAFDTSYLEEGLTTERFLDVLRLLEVEVFGSSRFRGPRKVVVSVGEPLNVRGYMLRYAEDRQTILEEVTRRMEDSVKGMLARLSLASRPLKE